MLIAQSAETRKPFRLWRGWPLLPSLLFLAVLFVYPLATLLSLSISGSDGHFSLMNYRELFASTTYVRVLGTTFKIAFWTTVLSILAGYPLAYIIATVSPRTRSGLLLWVLVPLWTSFLVRTFALIVLLGRNGAINSWLKSLGVIDAPLPLIYNFAGVLVGMVHGLMPLAVLTMVSVMRAIDPQLGRAAATLGARNGQWFWRVYFPLSLPGVAAAALLVFITALGFFITPALLGGGREVMIPQVIIQQVLELLNWGFAGAVAVLLLAAALIVFALYDRFLGISTLAGGPMSAAHSAGTSIVDRAGKATLKTLGAVCDAIGKVMEYAGRALAGEQKRVSPRLLTWICAGAVLLFLAAPSFLLIPVSFTEGDFIEWPPRGATLRWYELFLSSPTWLWAVVRSGTLALASSILALLLGVPAAFALVRARIRGGSAILALILAPLIVPRILTAVALFYFYSKVGLVGTWFGLMLGHVVVSLPYVVITVMAVLRGYDERLDQAALVMGASRLRTFIRVTFPLIAPAVLSAFLFAFVTSLDELTIVLFISGGPLTTLPKQMWDDAILNVGPTVTAVSTVLLVVIVVLITLATRLNERSKTQS